ncbi:unnamed protein product [Ranitomeya imitator]|uniref:Cell division cycle protein 27 homolog n=1 Tax=Ranitomeya imitator TaxID=111125 RepID=A0ABN9KY26_9NEOB|nr:unnamed protein product [Ranitomeya imitator]
MTVLQEPVQNAMSKGPSMTSRSGDRSPDRDVIEGPSLTAFLGTEADACSAENQGSSEGFTWYCKWMENRCESTASKPLRIRSVCTSPYTEAAESLQNRLCMTFMSICLMFYVLFFFLNIQAAIWQALNHYAYRDAVFLAERLYAEVHSEEALFLLATCYYRSGKAYKAYRLLKTHSCATPQCKYLLAKCCVDLSKLAEGEQILSGGVLNKQKSQEEIVTEFGDSACFTLSLLGHVYCKTDRLAKGSECYQKSLSLNPFLWSPFEALCEIGEKPDPEQTFKLTSLQNFSSCLPNTCTLMVNNHNIISHRQADTVLMETPQDTIGTYSTYLKILRGIPGADPVGS